MPGIHPGTDRRVSTAPSAVCTASETESHHEPLLRSDIAGLVTDAVAVANHIDHYLGKHLNATSRVIQLRADRPR